MLGNGTTDCYEAPLAPALSAQIEKVAFKYSSMHGGADVCEVLFLSTPALAEY